VSNELAHFIRHPVDEKRSNRKKKRGREAEHHAPGNIMQTALHFARNRCLWTIFEKGKIEKREKEETEGERGGGSKERVRYYHRTRVLQRQHKDLRRKLLIPLRSERGRKREERDNREEKNTGGRKGRHA